MDLIRVRVLVSGLVQGVNYRAECKRKATQLGLCGWVRNLPDGRVEAVFQGPKERVEEMLRWCEIGPRMARVEKIQAIQETPQQDCKSFDIVYYVK